VKRALDEADIRGGLKALYTSWNDILVESINII